MVAKRVAIVGAGASGLVAMKCCLDEGLEPVCFERTDFIGGLWHYTRAATENQACVMKSTVINTSKEMMCFSDFPIPQEYSTFMHNKFVDKYTQLYADACVMKSTVINTSKEMMCFSDFPIPQEYPTFMHNKFVDKYMQLYADEFKLRKYIHFKTEILHIKPTDDHQKTGRWNVTYRPVSSSESTSTTEVYDAVMVCSGHHAEKNVAKFPGMDKFRGKVVHSHDYRDSVGYEDQRVVIVGIGNSGGDVAVELSRIASEVFLSTRRGSWVLNRVAEQGQPIDMLYSTRFKIFLKNTFPNLAARLIERHLNHRFDHKRYSLQPKHSVLAQHVMLNDDLPNRIISGRVRVKSNIREFTENGVIFDDGTDEADIDTVILATGYVFGFRFLDKDVIDVKENKVELYKYMFPPEMEKNTLAVIGCMQPIGAIMPISEMQCRLAVRVFSGATKLPNRATMWTEIRRNETEMAEQYVQSVRHTLQVDYIPFMDELAVLAGCKPDLKTLFLTDPRMFLEVAFGPGTPYQYRLMGPGKWSGARKAIMTQWDRTYYPLETARDTGLPKDGGFRFLYILIVLAFALLVYIMGLFESWVPLLNDF